ncbi:glycosyltransferase [Williamsia sp. M5A3_1d]
MHASASVNRSISVVIAAKNAEMLIGACLTSVLPQLHDGDELVVVDDHSTDATTDICAAMGVRVVANTHASGPYGARNLGAEIATGDALVFFDTRCRARDGWLQSHRTALFDADRPVISYSDVTVAEIDAPAAQVARHLNPFSAGTYAKVGFYPACNLGMRRELFTAAGGFEEIRGGADVGLCSRATALGAAYVVDPATRVVWHPRERFRELQEQYRRYGTSSFRQRDRRAPVLVLDTAAFLGVRALGTFIGAPSSRSSLRARLGASVVQTTFESAILRAALADATDAVRRSSPLRLTRRPTVAEVEGFEPPVRVN